MKEWVLWYALENDIALTSVLKCILWVRPNAFQSVEQIWQNDVIPLIDGFKYWHHKGMSNSKNIHAVQLYVV